ncbi:hypothetical protein B9J93_02630 [Vibrio sp. V17_P4S1T151]|uniref:hypothetical protein n=1 Tax=unclassified Vibrio TaxID=2614977 RepID=UPI000B8EBE1D|nr:MULTISPECIES: hypothetical protein [unclassified Vibrio]OXX49411.1 hypothetical protein B9J93_02630 [Vibrio sp. V17_P4S1T151]OXX65019.1 hypothetical protein B9J89_03825 [Vibrio sp. V15_P4S5T153]
MPNESLVPKLFMLDGEQAKLVMTEIEDILEKELSSLNAEVQQYRQKIATTLASWQAGKLIENGCGVLPFGL